MPFLPRSVPAKQSLTGGTITAVLASAATRTHQPTGWLAAATAETSAQWVVPAAGTLSNLKTRLDAASQAGQTITFAVQVNGLDSTLTTVHANSDGTNVVTDSTHTVTVAAGDLVRIGTVTTGTQAGCDGTWSFDYARS